LNELGFQSLLLLLLQQGPGVLPHLLGSVLLGYVEQQQQRQAVALLLPPSLLAALLGTCSLLLLLDGLLLLLRGNQMTRAATMTTDWIWNLQERQMCAVRPAQSSQRVLGGKAQSDNDTQEQSHNSTSTAEVERWLLFETLHSNLLIGCLHHNNACSTYLHA
jgi:hypothetical protein